MSATTLPAPPLQAPPVLRAPPAARRTAKVLVWLLGIPAVLLLLLYAVLLITPIRLPFGSEAARAMASAALPPSSNLQLGDMALALEHGVWPVVRFSPVSLTDTKSGARIAIAALEIGFSPARALFGQPGATITIVEPHIQIVQDLFGTRPTSFEVLEDPTGGRPTVRVQEGEDTFPPIAISSSGIDISGTANHAPMRSDNDWLIYNLESSERGLADIVSQTAQGRFSRLVIRDGVVDMSDSVFGLFRRYDKLNLSLAPTPHTGTTTGTFSAELGGRTLTGSLSRSVDDEGNARLEADITNIDFAAFLPFIDDPASMAALRGAGALSIDANFAPAGGKLVDGSFKVDLTGLDLRVEDAYYPIATTIMNIDWSPTTGQFQLQETALQIGQSTAKLSGVFALGLDPAFGPTLAMSIRARDVAIHPTDMAAPVAPFDSLEISGWSAPLYGALGVDRLFARKGQGTIEGAGRIDMLNAGMAVDFSLIGQGISADDLKRLWPYMLATESRASFLSSVSAGTVTRARMDFDFPLGSLVMEGPPKPVPEGALKIDLVGQGVTVKPTPEMAPIAIEGDTRLQVNDTDVTISAGGGRLQTADGEIAVRNPAIVMDNTDPTAKILEISGDVTGSIPAMLALAKAQQPGLLENADLPLDPAALTGMLDAGIVATIHLHDEASGLAPQFDYVVNGTVTDFASSAPVQGRTIDGGQLAFSASQGSYQLGGTTNIDGVPAEIEITGTPTTAPVARLSSTIDVAELEKFGFDANPFLQGKVRFVAQPMPDQSIALAIDLVDASVSVRDLGITKAVGTAGSLTATIRQDGDLTEISQIDLAFGTVRANGNLLYDAKTGLQAATFENVGLSTGDSARLAVTPIDNGYSVTVSGAQLDLKPILGRFFSLGEGSGGVQSTQFDQTIALDLQLDRALGYYATTAFNLDVDLLLRGSDMRRANLTAQFADGNALSVTTNPAPRGRTLSLAFNDAGTILRLLGVYSQLAGGQGSLILTTDSDTDTEAGQLVMRDFAIVDEANVAQILGNRADFRAAIAEQNRLDFDLTEVNFLRGADRVEVTNALITGPTVGGTMRGFIYTDQRQYDLAGTYVPLFGLNSAFQKIPLLGPLLGGRDGEGLLGVTFAVQGALSNPQFIVNPLSALVPGALRELFEFRAKGQPAAQ